MKRTAILSPCGRYRYSLTRQWREAEGARLAIFILLNPSTADTEQDDATIRRSVCALVRRPLHCLRTTKVGDPVHPLMQPYHLMPRPWSLDEVRR